MSYVYIRTEPQLWTAGHYTSAGKWEPESDHGSPEEAAARVAWLNGAAPAPATAAATLDTEQLGRVLGALADAAEYRRKEAAQWCADCEASPAEACKQHLDDLDAAQAYDELGAALGRADDDPDEPTNREIEPDPDYWHDGPDPADYDPGPEVDDEGGMSEYRYVLPEDYERGQS